MSKSFDPRPLEAFFKEVVDQLNIQLHYAPDNVKYPIQLTDQENGISHIACLRLLEFIKAQVDLKDKDIGKIYPNKKKSGYVLIEISQLAAHDLAQIYGLSLFYDVEEDSTDV